jgi:hypothetical protein
MYNNCGIKYFMYITSLNNNLYLPAEIRKIIWEECHLLKIIECWICNKVLVNFNVNILNKYNENSIENYSIINGITKCNKCFVD